MQGNNIKAATPPRKGGFTWTHKYYWIPAGLGEEKLPYSAQNVEGGAGYPDAQKSKALGKEVRLSMAKPAEIRDNLDERFLFGLSGAKE